MKPNKSVFMSKTDFYKAIYNIVNEIPEGCVVTYGQNVHPRSGCLHNSICELMHPHM